MNPITFMFQDEPDKPPRAARMVWDEHTRSVFADVIAEACAHAVASAFNNLGVGSQEHGDQHKAMTVLIPWIEAQKTLAERRTEFVNKLLKDNVQRGLSAVLWLGVVAVLIGVGRALHMLSPELVQAIVK